MRHEQAPGACVQAAIRQYFFSEQDVRRSIMVALRSMQLKVSRPMTAMERVETRTLAASVAAQIIELNKRYRHFAGRSQEQVLLNRDRIRQMITAIRTIDTAIEQPTVSPAPRGMA